MIAEEKVSDLHELVRLYQQRDKLIEQQEKELGYEKEKAWIGSYGLADIHQDNAAELEQPIMELDCQIELLLTKHDLKV